MIKTINVDILESDCNIICQSVNHQGIMKSGLAKTIKNKYPEIEKGYINHRLLRPCKRIGFSKWIL